MNNTPAAKNSVKEYLNCLTPTNLMFLLGVDTYNTISQMMATASLAPKELFYPLMIIAETMATIPDDIPQVAYSRAKSAIQRFDPPLSTQFLDLNFTPPKRHRMRKKPGCGNNNWYLYQAFVLNLCVPHEMEFFILNHLPRLEGLAQKYPQFVRIPRGLMMAPPPAEEYLKTLGDTKTQST